MNANVMSMRGSPLRALLVGLVLALGCERPEGQEAPPLERQAQAVNGQVKRALVSGGVRHSLSVKPDGTVWAWGANSSGQLGDGTIATRTQPVQAPGLSAMKSVAAGYQHSLALGTNGKVWAWGSNGFGQLGEATTTTRRLIPTQVAGVGDGVDMAAGLYHSLVLRADGTVWAWGANSYGQLGDNSTSTRVAPTQVGVGTLPVTMALAAGAYHSLALSADGTVWTWGSNSYGQLGESTTTTRRSVPVQVPGLTGVVAISAGYYHSLALRVDGSVWAWGENLNGQLGDGTTTRRSVPAQVPGLSGVVALGGGGLHSLALGTDGAVWVWGSNTEGQLGNTTRTHTLTPVRLQAPSDVVALDGGDMHSLAQRADGTLWAWGDNGYGQVGNATLVDQLSPVQVLAASARGMVSSGTWFSTVLRADGTVWCFGYNENYQIGSTGPLNIPTPTQVTGISNVRAVSAGGDFVIALRADGTVWGWGNNGRAQLGDGTAASWATPVRVRDPEDATGLKPLSHVAAVSAGFTHSLALRSDGTVWAWGYNESGQIGDGNTASLLRFVPVKVPGLTDVVAVSGGRNHSLALRSDGTVWAWGGNADGQLGIGSTVSSSTPVQVPGLDRVVAVAAGQVVSRAIRADGTVWTWGNNYFGQLGNGQAPVNSLSPVQVPGLDRMVALSDHSNSVLALRADGTLWGWGNNHGGQVGNGTTAHSVISPVRSVALDGLVSLGGGHGHSVVMLADGTVWSWGDNRHGQLGDSTMANHLMPFQVPLPP